MNAYVLTFSERFALDRSAVHPYGMFRELSGERIAKKPTSWMLGTADEADAEAKRLHVLTGTHFSALPLASTPR